MKRSRKLRHFFENVLLIVLTMSISACNQFPTRKSSDQTSTTDSSAETMGLEEPVTSETIDLSGYYFQKHPIQEENGNYDSKLVNLGTDKHFYGYGGVLLFDDFFCCYTYDESAFYNSIAEFAYDGELICDTDLPFNAFSMVQYSDDSVILQAFIEDEELTRYYEFSFSDHSWTEIEQLKGISGQLMDYENERLFFLDEGSSSYVECYDINGNFRYKTGSLSSDGYSTSADWFVINGTVYATFYSSKREGYFRLMKYDENGDRVFNEEYQSNGVATINSQNNIATMTDQEGCWILDNDSFTWIRLLSWEKKESSLIHESAQTAVTSDEQHVILWNLSSDLNSDLSLLTRTGTSVEDKSVAIAGFNDTLNYKKVYGEYDWEYVPFPIEYSNVYLKEYLNAQGKPKADAEIVDELIEDFKNGDVDVLFLSNFTDESMTYNPSLTLRKVRQLEYEGYCLDLSQFVEPYINGTQEWNHPIPVSLVSKYASQDGLFAIPAGLPRLEGLYEKKSLKFKDEDSYAEWVEYAEKKSSDTPLLYFSPAGWVTQCLGYDLDSFVDYDTNQAHFDCQEFSDILTLAKQYTGSDTVLTNNTNPFSTAKLTNRYILDRLEKNVSDYTKIGVPSCFGTGFYMNSDVVILVSSKCDDPQLAWEVIEDYMDWCMEFDEYKKWSSNEGEKLQDANYVYYPDPEILDIVYQETDAYFYEDQSFEKTASSINEQVQEVLKQRNK